MSFYHECTGLPWSWINAIIVNIIVIIIINPISIISILISSFIITSIMSARSGQGAGHTRQCEPPARSDPGGGHFSY